MPEELEEQIENAAAVEQKIEELLELQQQQKQQQQENNKTMQEINKTISDFLEKKEKKEIEEQKAAEEKKEIEEQKAAEDKEVEEIELANLETFEKERQELLKDLANYVQQREDLDKQQEELNAMQLEQLNAVNLSDKVVITYGIVFIPFILFVAFGHAIFKHFI